MDQPDHDKYMLAFATLRFATDAFEETMRRVVRGEIVEPGRLELDATALMRLHTRWLEMSLLLSRATPGLLSPAAGSDDALEPRLSPSIARLAT